MRNGLHHRHTYIAWGMLGVLGQRTIGQAIDFALAHPDANLWFDMEGRIRYSGWLDLDAVETVCEAYKRYAERLPKGGPIQ